MSTVEGPLLWEGVWMIIQNGGCHCDPPGCGMEFCTGHCQLRAELEAARAEIERLKSENENLETLRQGQRDRIDFEVGRYAQSRATEAELRAALGQVWSTLINQMCVAGSEAWKIADDVLDVETKKQLLRAELDDDELAALDAQEPRT